MGGSRKRALGCRHALVLAAAASGIALAACGTERQDADAVEGEFPIEVTIAELAEREPNAEATELRLGVENVGSESLPDLAVSLFVDEEAGDAFSIRLDDRTLADPDRPVWILEEKYPRLVGEPLPSGSGATTAEANTFAFGPLAVGETKEMIWLITPVRSGTYVLNYEIAAGLQGPARAVTESGADVRGAFPVRISEKPKKERVNAQGKVVVDE